MISLLNLGTPFQQGYNAAKHGLHHNPYKKNSYEHANWYFGYCIFFDAEEKNIFSFQLPNIAA